VVKDSLDKEKNNFVVGKLVALNTNVTSGEVISLLLVNSMGNVVKRINVHRDNYFVFRDLPSDNYYVIEEDNNPNYSCSIFYHNPDKSISISRADLLEYHYKHLTSDSLRENNLILHGKVNLDHPQDITVLLLDDNDNVINKTVTNGDGFFVFRDLDAEDMHVVAVNDHALLSLFHTTVYQGEDSVYHVTKSEILRKLPFDESALKGKTIINGRLTMAEKPLANKLLLLVGKDGKVVAHSQTNEDGFFAFHRLSPDDFYIVVDEKEPKYLLERHLNLEDSDHILTENHFKKEKPDGFFIVKGSAYNKADKKKLEEKLMLLLDKTGKVIRQTVTGKDGSFTFVNLKPDYYLVLFNNYHPDQKVKLKVTEESPTTVTQTEKGKKVTIKLPIAQEENKAIIFFDYNSNVLEKKYAEEIKRFIKLASQSESKEIEVHGYTDLKGSDTFNLALSKKRVKSCTDVIKKSLGNENIIVTEMPEGKTNRFHNTYGSYIPALNRRVELKIKEKAIPQD
jgi:outer membrane protein OmpA-like peptidoglycan-associated protein